MTSRQSGKLGQKKTPLLNAIQDSSADIGLFKSGYDNAIIGLLNKFV
jgi:hypothetical protein